MLQVLGRVWRQIHIVFSHGGISSAILLNEPMRECLVSKVDLLLALRDDRENFALALLVIFL